MCQSYVLKCTLNNETAFYCTDRKYRRQFLVGNVEGCIMTYKKTNNATTMGKRLVLRKKIDAFEVTTLDVAHTISETLLP
jgi:hypothetical protein